MKEDYKKPILEIIEFKAEDIITTSGSCACVEGHCTDDCVVVG